MGCGSPAAREVTATLLRDWQAELAAGVRRTQEAGDMALGLEPDRTAAALVAAVQGGVVVLLSTGDIDHLEAALEPHALASLRGLTADARGRRGQRLL